jgi:hypothetical protein
MHSLRWRTGKDHSALQRNARPSQQIYALHLHMPGYQDVLALPRALAPLQPSFGGDLFCCVQTDYTPERNMAEAVGLGSHIATLHGHLLKSVFALSVSSGNEDAFT